MSAPAHHRPPAPFLPEASLHRIRRRLREAISRQPERFDLRSLLRQFDRNMTIAERLAVEGLVISSTVNDPRRQHFPSPIDLIFLREDGLFERYEVGVHGMWSTVGLPRPSSPEPLATEAARTVPLSSVSQSLRATG